MIKLNLIVNNSTSMSRLESKQVVAPASCRNYRQVSLVKLLSKSSQKTFLNRVEAKE